MADALRELVAHLGFKVDEHGLEKAMLGVEAIKKGAEKLVESIKGAAEQLLEMFHAVAEQGEKFEQLAQRTGIAASALQAMDASARLMGVDGDVLTTGMRKLSLSMLKASEGSEESAQAFAKLGIHVKGSNGKLRPLDAVLGDIAEKFKTMPNGAEKLALATQLLSRGGGALIPYLNKGAAGIAEMKKELEELGVLMDEQTLAASAELQESFKKLDLSFEGLKLAIVKPLLEPMRQLVDAVRHWVVQNRALIASGLGRFIKLVGLALSVTAKMLAPVLQGLLKLLDTSLGSKLALGGLVAVLAVLAAGFVAVGVAAWAAVAGEIAAAAPIIAIAAAALAAMGAIALLTNDLLVFAHGGKSVTGELNDGFTVLSKAIVGQLKGWFTTAISFWKQELLDFSSWLLGMWGQLPAPARDVLMGVARISPVVQLAEAAGGGGPLGLGGGAANPSQDAPLGLGGGAANPSQDAPLGLGGGAANPSQDAAAGAAAASAVHVMAPQMRANVTVNTPPGADAVAVGNAVRESLDDWWAQTLGHAMDGTVGQYGPAGGG